ncbi:rhamnulokinase [Frankia sp. AgB1.9]|uniref:rhamnulokinase n=1 Tax=unclassified Frankia TaxID=2632575 RepID=UPI00193241C6|nr:MULTISPECIES: rhamnulokinase family protein [unclassified Frankia]MBL7488333.1 rhamnulokinase [Frankia sp. AgW1.1]MBL7548512.1 rhamnulokinase [Frankia sp. AgB1.9]MBL7619591.1 rhamnulokinase [Frankia sp. AgB1.8]
MRQAAIAAVDLGASSGRVSVARIGPAGADLREVHRFPNAPVRAGGRLRWDVLALFAGLVEGLRRGIGLTADLDGVGLERAGLDSVGVDGWAVDYGLLDADGELLGNPVSYRDAGTSSAVAAVLGELSPDELYAATGTQLQPFNTLFQLLARRDTAQSAAARHALLIPDLMTYWLTGELRTELTNASTTQLLDPRTADWSTDLAGRLGVPVDLFPPLAAPGTPLGLVRADLGLAQRPQVVLAPSHDTAAAVAGIPADGDDFAFVCTGTWALVGVELPKPVITPASRAANFTNELGVDGTTRFLRNVTGFWLLQECVRHWREAGDDVDLPGLVAAAADVPGLRVVIDVQDPEFAPPGDMPARVRAAAARVSGVALDSRAEVARCVLDSLALAVRRAVRTAAELSGRPVRVLHLVGGGVANTLFCQLVADACELPVLAGPTEAASWGTVLTQARALGAVEDSLAASRTLIARAAPPVRYTPTPSPAWDRADHECPTAEHP